MKIFAVSDIHSFFTPFKNALDEAGFEIGNKNHLLVVCGDLFDRGDESQQVRDYLISVPNKVLIKGNHETLFEELCERGYPCSHDLGNGTMNTVYDLSVEAQWDDWDCDKAMKKIKPLLNEMVNYYETEHYIFVHSFIPLKCLDKMPVYYTTGRKFEYDQNWRKANAADFETARWGNPFKCASKGLNKTGKIIVHGHWHNSAGWAMKGIGSEFGDDACFDICEHDGCIGLDACTAYTNKVNVLVLEDELLEE